MTPSRRAFSQIELLVALGVLAVGILAVYASLTFSLKASRHSDSMARAIALNRLILDLVRSRGLDRTTAGLNDGPGQRRPVDAAPFAADIPGNPPFERNVQIDPVSTDASRPESALRRVKVTIFWREQGGERSVVFEGYQRQP